MERCAPRAGTLARVHGTRPGLPRGHASLPRKAVRAAHRGRLLRAMTAASADKGYASVTIADIVQRARVSRNVFYEHFADKEACFLAAREEGVELMFARIAQATRAQGADAPATSRLRAALRAWLQFFVDEPEFARTMLIEAFAAGPRATVQFVAAHRRFAANTRSWYMRARREHPAWPSIPDEVHVAIVGALHELAVTRVREDRTAQLPELEDTAFNLHMAVLSGWPSSRTGLEREGLEASR